jgi:hypothetical protein
MSKVSYREFSRGSRTGPLAPEHVIWNETVKGEGTVIVALDMTVG